MKIEGKEFFVLKDTRKNKFVSDIGFTFVSTCDSIDEAEKFNDKTIAENCTKERNFLEVINVKVNYTI